MKMSDSVVFPCDTPEWLDVKEKLSAARNMAHSSLQDLIIYLQKVTTSVAPSFTVHDYAGARPKTWNMFGDLSHCLDDRIASDERESYLTRLLLHAIDRAVAIESLRPSKDILACRENRGMLCTEKTCRLLLVLDVKVTNTVKRLTIYIENEKTSVWHCWKTASNALSNCRMPVS